MSTFLIVLSGCGSSTRGKGGETSHGQPTALAHDTKVTLILDYTPNAVHVGIYRALAAGYYREENIDLEVVTPTSTTQTLKLIDAGRAQFGLADGSDVAGLIAAGGDAKVVMTIVQRPVGGLIALASEHLSSAAALDGETVGITGVPSDIAVLDTVVAHAGGDPGKVHVVTVGYNGAQALLAGKIQAFTGFIPDDGVQLQVDGHPITAFGLAEGGGPEYPGLVAFTTEHEISVDPDLVRDFVWATVSGYEATIVDPSRSLEDLLTANPSLQRRFTAASLRAYLPLFTDSGKVPFGKIRSSAVTEMSRWMVDTKLIAHGVSAGRYATNEFLPR